tara:strand:- start:7954 stop:8817 length:864 start_codon:yes stop_codon:yes gene_type:complete
MKEKQDELFEAEERVEAVEVEIEAPADSTDDTATVEQVEESSDEEHKSKVSDTKARIDRLTKKMREAERREEEAIRYAQARQAEAEQLKSRLNDLDQFAQTQFHERVDTQLEDAKNQMRQALSIGDSEQAVAAQERIAQLTVSKQAPVAPEPSTAPPTEAQAPAAQPPRRRDPRAEQWAEENEWFGKDQAMTYAAFGIHKQLVENKGLDPKSEDYYTALDEAVRREFPHKFEDPGVEEERKPIQNVASASRTAKKSGSKKVRLTEREVAIAKKLGVPLEEYAKYVKR